MSTAETPHGHPERLKTSVDEFLPDELQVIADRRCRAFPDGQCRLDDPSGEAIQEIRGSLSGLALSGGGVRSGAFNLGLLQALYENGVLKQVDYLSTVSGGGYAGAHLTSLGQHPHARFTSRATNGNGSVKSPLDSPVKETLGAGREGLEAPAVQHLAEQCRYLNQPSHFLNRQLIGALLLNTVTMSGLVSLTAFLAWLYRSLDEPEQVHRLTAAGIHGDFSRAMFPFVVLFGLWVIAWLLSFFRNRSQARGRTARIFLVLWVAALFLGGAVAIGTGELSFTSLREKKLINPETETWISSVSDKLGYAVALAIVGGLLPYFHPKALLRSATTKRRGVRRLIYRAASISLLFGVPLLLFAWFAQEDLSNRHTLRKGTLPGLDPALVARNRAEVDWFDYSTGPDLCPASIRDWLAFASFIRQRSTQAGSDPTMLPKTVAERIEKAMQRAKAVRHDRSESSFRHLQEIETEIKDHHRDHNPIEDLVSCGWSLVSGDEESLYWRRVELRRNQLLRKYEIVNEINQVLGDPSLFTSVSPENPPKASSDELAAWISKRDGLVAEATQAKKLFDEFIRETPSKELQFEQTSRATEAALGLVRGHVITANSDLSVGDVVNAMLRAGGQDNVHNAVQFVALFEKIRKTNRELLDLYCLEHVQDRNTVFSQVVFAHDQEARLWWAVCGGLLFLLTAFLANVNYISLQGVYRDALTRAWIVDPTGNGGGQLGLSDARQRKPRVAVSAVEWRRPHDLRWRSACRAPRVLVFAALLRIEGDWVCSDSTIRQRHADPASGDGGIGRRRRDPAN